MLVATSSIVDPGPLPWTWLWELYQQVTDRQMYTFTRTETVAGPSAHTLQYGFTNEPSVLSASQVLTDGENLHVKVYLRNDTGQVVDQGELTIPWNNSIQQHTDLMLQLRSITSTGGYTQADRDAAAITQMGVTLPLPALDAAGEIASGLTGFFTSPPSWAMQVLDGIELRGRGTVTRPGAGRSVNAYGCQLDFLEVPLELGLVVGAPDIYDVRVAHLSTVLVGLANREYYDKSAQVYSDHQRFMWGTPFPTRIEYSIVPGGTVLLTWLHLAPNWWPF